MWRRFTHLIKHSFLVSLGYRSEVFLWILLSIVPTAVVLLIWVSVYQGASELRGFQLSQLLQYLFIATVISGITSSHFESWRAREIREGKIDYLLTKPISYLTQVFLHDLGAKIFYIAYSIPIFIFSYWFLSQVLPISGIQFSLINFLQFCILIVYGYLVEFFLALIVLLLTFWFENGEGLEHFKMLTISLLSGMMIPIVFMPPWLQSIVQALPLKYMYAWPIEILQQRQTLQIQDLLYAAAFLLFLYGLVRLLWRRALLRYCSAGG